MNKTIVSILISLSLSLCLLLGEGDLAAFAFYICAAFNVLAWLGVVFGGVSGEAADQIRRRLLISLPTTILSIYALIYSGHPGWAASSAIVSVMIIAIAHAKGKEASA